MIEGRAVHVRHELQRSVPQMYERPLVHLAPIRRQFFLRRHYDLRQELENVSRGIPICGFPADFGGAIDGVVTLARARSSRPLNTAARSRPSSVIALYSTSAATSGLTQVAFGFLTGTERAVNA